MYSHEDRFLNLYAALARNFGIIPLLNEGSALVQPVYAVDVATAIYHSFLVFKTIVLALSSLYHLFIYLIN